jgi:hypothetical protein
MAGSNHDPRGREIEEGEIDEGEVVSWYSASAGTGSDTDTDDEDAWYHVQPHRDDRRGPGIISALSPASSFGSGGISDGTVSDAAAATGVRAAFPCPVCRREFKGWMAVVGHMKVHARAAPKEEDKFTVAAVVSGGASAVEEVGDSVSESTPSVVAESKVSDSDDTTVPAQSACSNNPVVNGGSGSSNASEKVPIAPTPAPPQQATFIPLMIPAASQSKQRVLDGPTTWRQAPAGRGFSCKECGQWFPTHQGLGGHAAGHKNRRLAAEAVAAAAAGIDIIACSRPERPHSHACKICGDEYQSGVSLGGHMTKHNKGNPIVHRKRMRLAPPMQQAPPGLPELELALAPHMPQAPPAAPPQVPAGSVRIFGVIFEPQAKKDDEEKPRDDE